MAKTLQRSKLLDALWKLQNQKNYISDNDIEKLSETFNLSKIELEGVVSFYHFFHREVTPKYVVYLNNSIISKFEGYSKVKQAFESATGAIFGKRHSSEDFALFETSCIGLSDMEPAALINFHPFTNLTGPKIHQIINDIRSGVAIDKLCDHPESIVQYTPEKDKTILLREYTPGEAIKKLKGLSKESVIQLIKMGKLTGLGGAFFPTALKWESCKKQKAKTKYVVCNADEGEPGTFKDRHLLRLYPGLMIEGMIICAYAIEASQGIIYLRAEYNFLKKGIEDTLKVFRKKGWLGKDVVGVKGFSFDVRVQMGAGAYVCGEETALLNSMEGERGEPRAKVWFPTERGFLMKPTVVNNVETFCVASRILELGVRHIENTGIPTSHGTKLISISGDCEKPGIYEIEWGMTVRELLDLCQAQNTKAVQMSGPAGEMLSSEDFDKRISLTGLRCGGSLMVFNEERNILDIIQNFNQFFIDESCGVCTPCRAGNFILGRELRRIRRGLIDKSESIKIRKWSKIMRSSSRCGLGRTAPNSIINGLEKFPEIMDNYAKEDPGLNTFFNLEEAVKDYEMIIQKNNQR